jgi:hypothetical protein
VVHLVSALAHLHDRVLGCSHALVEQTEFDAGGILCKEREVYALTVPGSAEWIRYAWILLDIQWMVV